MISHFSVFWLPLNAPPLSDNNSTRCDENFTYLSSVFMFYVCFFASASSSSSRTICVSVCVLRPDAVLPTSSGHHTTVNVRPEDTHQPEETNSEALSPPSYSLPCALSLSPSLSLASSEPPDLLVWLWPSVHLAVGGYARWPLGEVITLTLTHAHTEPGRRL